MTVAGQPRIRTGVPDRRASTVADVGRSRASPQRSLIERTRHCCSARVKTLTERTATSRRQNVDAERGQRVDDQRPHDRRRRDDHGAPFRRGDCVQPGPGRGRARASSGSAASGPHHAASAGASSVDNPMLAAVSRAARSGACQPAVAGPHAAASRVARRLVDRVRLVVRSRCDAAVLPGCGRRRDHHQARAHGDRNVRRVYSAAANATSSGSR